MDCRNVLGRGGFCASERTTSVPRQLVSFPVVDRYGACGSPNGHLVPDGLGWYAVEAVVELDVVVRGDGGSRTFQQLELPVFLIESKQTKRSAGNVPHDHQREGALKRCPVDAFSAWENS